MLGPGSLARGCQAPPVGACLFAPRDPRQLPKSHGCSRPRLAEAPAGCHSAGRVCHCHCFFAVTRSSPLTSATLRRVREWSVLWGVPDLAETVEVVFSGRLRSSLGRCAPARGRIRLSTRLLDDERARFREVLCHELAHVAVHRLHGSRAAPHGAEWRGLVVAAGFVPSVRACVVETSTRSGGDSGSASTDYGHGHVHGHVHGGRRGSAAGSGSRRSSGAGVLSGDVPPSGGDPAARVRFAHRCPVCQTVRYARGPVHRWRCAACLDAGLDGVLEITSEPVRRA
jgi:SprT-like family